MPKLSHLSGGDWQKKKAHIKERVSELADRLIALYGQRAKQTGYAFPPDDELQKKFEDEFPYQLTPDQVRSVEEIKRDMNDQERKEVAFHEAGHAVIGLVLPYSEKVQKITIIPRGRTGGHVLMKNLWD